MYYTILQGEFPFLHLRVCSVNGGSTASATWQNTCVYYTPGKSRFRATNVVEALVKKAPCTAINAQYMF